MNLQIFFWRLTKLYRQKRNNLLSYYYHLVLRDCPKDLRVGGLIMIDPLENVVIGRRVVINEGCYINARAKVFIGDDTHLSAFVKIQTGSLDIHGKVRMHATNASVIIGRNVWIATGVIINPGVTIGDGVVVGAGAVVTRNLPAYTLCVGVPAQPIKNLPRLD